MTATDLIFRAIISAATRCDVLGERVHNSPRLHLAVMREPYLSFVVEGTKPVESRFSRTRQPPFQSVDIDDLLLFKKTAGPVVACATVVDAIYFDMNTTPLSSIRDRFDKLIKALPDFWDDKEQARFASLLRIDRVTELEPFEVPKRDRRGWVVFNQTATEVAPSNG